MYIPHFLLKICEHCKCNIYDLWCILQCKSASENVLINSTLDIFFTVIIITNISVYVNHPQYCQGHKLCVRETCNLSEAEKQQVFMWVYKFVTSRCHLTCHATSIIKKRFMSLKFQVYGNRKVKCKFDPEVMWHPWLVCHFMGHNYHVLILWSTRHYLPDKKWCLSSVVFLGGLENVIVYYRKLIYGIKKLQTQIA